MENICPRCPRCPSQSHLISLYRKLIWNYLDKSDKSDSLYIKMFKIKEITQKSSKLIQMFKLNLSSNKTKQMLNIQMFK